MTVNMRRVDLNLLNVLHAVMAEGSVTRAARRLSMTQPAVSNALKRARELFGDELFVKVPRGIRPTERTIAIWPELDSALRQIIELTRPPRFSIETVDLTFRVAVTQALAETLVPILTKAFVTRAPRARLHFEMHTNDGSISSLEQGRLDCAVGMFPNPPAGLSIEGMLRDEYVCVMRANHPAADRLDLATFTSLNHVLVKQAPQARGFVDVWLELHGEKRPIVAIVNRFEDALKLVSSTDLLAAVPRRLAEAHPELSVAIRPLPFDAEPLIYKLLWHARTDRSPPQIWFRGLVRETITLAFQRR